MQQVNSLYAIATNPDGSLAGYGYSPNMDANGKNPNPQIFFPDGLIIQTFADQASYLAALTPLLAQQAPPVDKTAILLQKTAQLLNPALTANQLKNIS